MINLSDAILWVSDTDMGFFLVQYISLLFIGMLIVISVRGFLTNLMKVSIVAYLSSVNSLSGFSLTVLFASYVMWLNVSFCA